MCNVSQMNESRCRKEPAKEQRPLHFHSLAVLCPLWITAKGLHEGCSEAPLVGVGWSRWVGG